MHCVNPSFVNSRIHWENNGESFFKVRRTCAIGMNESRLTHCTSRRGVRGRGIGDQTRLCEQRRMINELRSAMSIVALLRRRIK